MRMLRSLVAATVALVLGTASAARAEEAAATPLNYVVAAVTTTLLYQPNQGSLDGPQRDVGPVVGFGRYVTDTVALELDLGPTFTRGDYTAFSLVPGVVWSFSSHAYAAARLVVPVDPKLNVTLFPGFGLIHTFKNQISLSLELNLASTVGRGDPDFGVTLTPGIVYSF
jgi:hypothetical protein